MLFLMHSKVNQLHIYIYPLFFGFLFHLGHHGALSRVSSGIQQVLISYLLYTQQRIYVNHNLPIHPTPSSPSGVDTFSMLSMSVCSLCLCLYFCFVNKIIYTNFFRFHIHALIYHICFYLSDLLYSVGHLQVHPQFYK